MLEILKDAILDSVVVFPFILLIYILMEIIESTRKKEKIEKTLSGFSAPLFAGALGVIPECGFSVMCAKLFDNGLIKLGTLITAFLCTSDEGLVVLISNGVEVKTIVIFVLYKAVFAIVIGILINLVINTFDNHHVCPEEDNCVECGEKHKGKLDKFLLHPLHHALITFLYIFVLNIVFGGLIEVIGQEKLSEFMQSSRYLQPILSSLIGLVPNCASSIIISQSYVNGMLCFPALMSGLCTNAGLGMLILFKNKKSVKRNLFVLLTLYVCGLIGGYISFLFGI